MSELISSEGRGGFGEGLMMSTSCPPVKAVEESEVVLEKIGGRRKMEKKGADARRIR